MRAMYKICSTGIFFTLLICFLSSPLRVLTKRRSAWNVRTETPKKGLKVCSFDFTFSMKDTAMPELMMSSSIFFTWWYSAQ
jgi:hypothetical protein